MIKFESVIKQFGELGEKTGWTYIEIPAELAQKLKPGNKRSFRVKGSLDNYKIAGVALMPMGGGDFIMALNGEMRKGIKKRKGAMLSIKLMEDKDFKIEMPGDLSACLDDEPGATEYFNSLSMSHRNYFIKWIESAKTEPTRIKRIATTIDALVKKWDYGQMLRNARDTKLK